METLYKRNQNGRYVKAGCYQPYIPEGLHLVYVKHEEGSKSTSSVFNISLDDVWKKAGVLVGKGELTDIVFKACELYPCEKLTDEEWQQWEEFKKTKAGQKLTKGMFRKSAADIARTILEKIAK